MRYHDTIARLELESAELGRAVELREALVALGKSCGFTYVALDLEGFRSGAMNETLTLLRQHFRMAVVTTKLNCVAV